jgi:predicted PilT family ATPase
MKKSILVGIFAILIAVVFTGCVTSTYTMGNNFTKNDITKIIKGKTGTSELIEVFGEPSMKIAISENEENWHYNHTTSTANSSGFIFIKVKSKVTSKTLNVLIKDNIVINYTITNVENNGLTKIQ